jgi:penicillin amidase
LVIAVAAVLFVAALLFGAWFFFTRWPYPQTRGTIKVEGLSAPVEVFRDSYGVPHIYARTSEDLFFAQGFVHAQDRFWQMEFSRRISAGRLSELFGKTTVETDKFMRTLGFHRLAEAEFEQFAPEEKRITESYAAGVNAYILHRRPARLGLEFALLKLQGVKFEIEPWTPADSIAWGKIMAYSLAGNMDAEHLAIDIMRTVGTKGLASFFRPYRSDMPFTVDDKELRKTLGAALGLTGRTGEAPVSGSLGIGSNNWVVSGTRTASGKPLLANDMHLGIQMPSIWYEIGMQGLRTDGRVGRSDACPYDMRGLSFPGTPGVIAGNNDRIAWGHTNLGGDVQDFYVEKLNPDNPDQYEVNGRWVDMEVRAETIMVNKAEEPVVIRVRSTRHGPVMSDRAMFADLGAFSVTTGRDFPAGVGLTAVALRWTALQPSRLVGSVLALDKASNFMEFREALRSWDIAAQNVVYADVDGNIGYQATGLQPIRARGRGLAPAPGWTNEYEWTGFIPFDRMPFLYNPEAGYIVTANAPIVGPPYPYFLGSEFAFGERSRRIRELIEARGKGLTMEDMQKIQGDVYDRDASELVPYLKDLDLAAAMRPWEPPLDTKKAELDGMAKARDRLLSWDFQMRRESPEAAMYAFFWMALIEETFRDQYPENLWPLDAWRVQNTLVYLLKEPNDMWWDDAGTPGVKETRDQILSRAFRKGYRAAVKKMGRRFDGWQWGKVHRAEFRNQTFGDSGIKPIERIFNRGPIAAPGGLTTVDVAQWNLKKPFEVKHIVSQRAIIDLANLGNSLSVISTGQSGHPTNSHYDDFIRPWRDVRYHPTLWERSQVTAKARERLILQPKKAR